MNAHGLADVLYYGRLLSNIAFNYKQSVGKVLEAGDVRILAEHQEKFDAANNHYLKQLYPL
jgi:hypothetical protein